MPDGDLPQPARGVRSWLRARAATVALAVLAAIVVFVVSSVVFPYHSTNHDEAVYLQQAAMLLEGRLFLRPPVLDAFRPWFFVREGDALYAKYTPVAAAVFALGRALAGSYRVALAAVAAGNVALVVALGREAFDRRTGLLAGGLLLTAPLFVVSSSVFLSYAPTTLFNLAFAYAYVRSARAKGSAAVVVGRALGASRRSLAWAVVAGVAVGLAFFARPYTAVLFATPFVAHAAYRVLVVRSRRAVAANVATGALGVAFVALALAYNATVTGDALTFPYQVFAPRDGLGFGTREILDYSREYTPALAVRSNAEAVARLALRWVPLGVAGTVLAAWGASRAFDGESTPADRGTEPSPVLPDRTLRALVLAVVPVVVLGNVAFWGTLNVLGDLDAIADGLVWTLGPYYHFDVLVPVSILAAWGGRDLAGRVRRRLAAASGRRRTAVLAGTAVVLVVVAAVGTLALAHPVAANHEISQHLADAYDVDREFDDAVVFLPRIYGDWLHHPLQAYRNDPGYDGDATYALDRGGGNFAVVDAFPDRTYYRYTYRGQWAPFRDESVDPRIQRVDVARGDRAGVDVSLGTPEWVVRGAVELTSDADSVAYYVNDTTDGLDARLVVADGRARLVGADVQPRTGNGSVPVTGTDTVTTTAFLDGRGSGGVTYRVETPVRAGDDGNATAVMTPYLEVCVQFDTCDGGAAYLPDDADPGVRVTVSVWANATALSDETGRADTRTRSSNASSADALRRVDGRPLAGVRGHWHVSRVEQHVVIA
jgi:4-amino-4-deoxy-L-arabinose transferase-like glycosyltransferase